METYKTGTVNTIINENGVDLGNINVNLYTMDNMTSVIDIHLKKKNLTTEQQEYIPVNFNQTKFSLYFMFLLKTDLFSLMNLLK